MSIKRFLRELLETGFNLDILGIGIELHLFTPCYCNHGKILALRKRYLYFRIPYVLYFSLDWAAWTGGYDWEHEEDPI